MPRTYSAHIAWITFLVTCGQEVWYGGRPILFRGWLAVWQGWRPARAADGQGWSRGKGFPISGTELHPRTYLARPSAALTRWVRSSFWLLQGFWKTFIIIRWVIKDLKVTIFVNVLQTGVQLCFFSLFFFPLPYVNDDPETSTRMYLSFKWMGLYVVTFNGLLMYFLYMTKTHRRLLNLFHLLGTNCWLFHRQDTNINIYILFSWDVIYILTSFNIVMLIQLLRVYFKVAHVFVVNALFSYFLN